MRPILLGFIWLVGVLACGCAETTPLSAGKSILWVPAKRGSQFVKQLGYSDIYPSITRSTKGDRLFVQFDTDGVYRVAVISSNGIHVKELPGQSCLNGDAEPVFWRNDPERTIQFAASYTVPTNTHTIGFISDGKFVAMYDRNHKWIARVQSPMQEIVAIPKGTQLEKLVSQGDRLHVFVKGQPEGKPRRDGWAILKHYEYQIEDSKTRLVQIQDFDFTWQVYDFDPETNLMLVRSWDDMFPHGWLVNTRTGARQRESLRGDAFILRDEVIRKFREGRKGVTH